jgi:hypothetical protein
MYFRTLKHTPGDFRIETTFNPRTGIYKVILDIPLLKYLISELFVRQGKIFLRPFKVDPTKPEQYWVEGFKVRNKSQRADGIYLTAGGVHRFKTPNSLLRDKCGREDLPR